MKQLNHYYSLLEAIQQVGPGWTPLIQRVYNAREAIGAPIGIIQVKEKYGGLRIYTEYRNDELEEVIAEVGTESFQICEECGAPGVLRKKYSRYFTACGFHDEGAEVVEKPWY
jgi:hypothetical protein